MKGFSFKKVLDFVKKKKSIFIALGIAIVVAIGLSIASSIMNSSKVSLHSEKYQLDAETSIDAGSVSGGGRKKRGASITVKATPNAGYKFVCWTNGDDDKTVASTDAEYKMIVPEKSISLTAHWEQVTYDLDLVIDDGNTVSSTFVVTDPTIFLSEPEKEGYTFLGWLAEVEQEDKKIKKEKVQDFVEPSVAKNVTLYADWALSYTIEYVLNPDGNANAAKAANPNNPSTYTERASVVLEDPVCYEFDAEGKLTGGWYPFDHWELNGEPVTTIDANKKENITLVAKWKDLETPKYYDVVEKDGVIQYVEFGQYPSRRLTDRKVLSELQAAIDAETITADPVTGYYTYKNSIYAKATADLYSKPKDKEGKKNNAYYPRYFEDGALIEEGEEYFFIVEPIRWFVLSGDPRLGEETVLLAESALTARKFKEDGTTITLDGQNIYGGNWAYSDIRAFLNDTFYAMAFKSGEAGFIQETDVDYSKATVNPQYKNKKWANGATCTDKVYLLSYADLTNKAYGWSTASKTEDLRRVAKTTDYSKTVGAYSCLNVKEANNSMSKDEYDFTVWWLRSTSDFAERAAIVLGPGSIGSVSVEAAYVGVRPAITVKFPAE